MPLSEHEQRILDEIERKLAEEDPKFARGVTAKTPRGQAVRQLKRAVAGFALGFIVLIAGLLFPKIFLVLGITAFAVMLASAVVIARNASHLARERTSSAAKQPKWMSRMEERWKKRFDKDDG